MKQFVVVRQYLATWRSHRYGMPFNQPFVASSVADAKRQVKKYAGTMGYSVYGLKVKLFSETRCKIER